MSDLEILKQLLNGNHLEDKELERALKLVYLFDLELEKRCSK